MRQSTLNPVASAGLLAFLLLTSACSSDSAPTAPRAMPHVNASTSTVTTTVTNTNDAGPGSLRQAILDATEATTIQFSPNLAGQTITLTSGSLSLNPTTEFVIEGPAAGITISGGNNFSVIGSDGTLTLKNLTITGGYAPAGAGISAGGKAASLRLENVLVVGNHADVNGGGIAVQGGGDLTIVNTTVTGNTAGAAGGGIFSNTGFSIINSTITGNAAPAGGGISTSFVSLRNSIIAHNTGGNETNCAPLTGAEYLGVNLSDDASCGTHANMLVAPPLLGALGNNGGPTRTHALLKESPAIDAAVACDVTVDQRYVARPQGAACDIGAFEFNDYITVAVQIDGGGTVNPKTGSTIVSGSVTCSAATPVGLEVALAQTQKARRGTAVVEAKGVVTIGCNGKTFWSIAIAPTSGAFLNSSASASVKTVNVPKYMIAATATGTVKLSWAK